jgi:trimethylamine--corrinoid protein Co-methyltransferase
VEQNLRQLALLRVFTDSQLETLRLASLEVLRRTGIKVLLPEAVDLLENAGCWVNGDRVQFPPHLVEWAIRTAPTRVVLCDRDGNPALHVGGSKSYFGTGSDCISVIDPQTGERREALIQDVADFARVVDALANIDFNLGMSVAHDVPSQLADLYQFRAMVTNTTKPLVYAAMSLKNLKSIVKICQLVAGGAEAFRRNPFAVLFGCSVSPLLFEADQTQKMLYTAACGLPYILAPSAIAGGTAPMTLAGAMVQMNAEMLAGLVMVELKREGTPFIITSGCPTPMDMRTTIASYGSAEYSLFEAGLTQLQKYQGLPTWGMAGCSDSKLFDQQAAAEGTLSLLMAALSGVNLIHDVGYIEYGKSSSYEMLVAMDELAGAVRFILNGIEVNSETLALEVIDSVGPGGHYLDTDHTLRHFRQAWMPDLVGDRHTFDAWKAQGEQNLGERANERVKHILQTHVSKPLPEAIEAEITRILGAEQMVAQ